MDEARADELGKKPIEADFARVDAIADKAALIPTMASFQREGVTGLFGGFVTTDAKKSDQYILYLNQSGLSLPDEAYYRDAEIQADPREVRGPRREDVRAGRDSRARKPRQPR